MVLDEFNRAIDDVFEDSQGLTAPYISLEHRNGYLLIDGYISYKDLIKLGEVVKQYVEVE
jgi:hypothetical protein